MRVMQSFLAALAGALCGLLLFQSSLAETTYIGLGDDAPWKFYDGSSAPPAAWRTAEFNDAAWSAGPAPLGYGEPEITTKLNSGADPNAKRITAYFRRSFTVANPNDAARLAFRFRCDDAAAVYLNGREIARCNLPNGPLEFQTPSRIRLDGPAERLYRHFSAPAAALVAGRNVLAVEVHQCNARSTDLFLDLALVASTEKEDLRPRLAPAAREATLVFHALHYVEPELRIPDGFIDGGRSMQFEPDGRVRSPREVLTVDRPRDAVLRDLLGRARAAELQSLPPIERARRLVALIGAQCEYAGNVAWILEATEALSKEYRNERLLIGEVAQLCGATACRHRALLFKLLADEAGLRAALVRGNYRSDKAPLPHAWNELFLDDGVRMVVEPTSDPQKAIFPPTQADRYLSVAGKPLYPITAPANP